MCLTIAACGTTKGLPGAVVGVSGVVALFEEAVSISESGGQLWVVDRAAHSVISIREGRTTDSSDLEIRRYAGAGTETGRLSEPTDVDPTNGLVIIVAEHDGAVKRFDRTFAPIGSYELPGQPLALASVDERTLFYIDGATNLLLRWTTERGPIEVDYAPGTTRGDPVDIAVTAREVFVADAHSGCLHVLDTFGSFKRIMSCGGEGALVSVVADEEVLIVARQAPGFDVVEAFEPAGRLLWRLPIGRRAGADLSGALVSDDKLWLLYRDALVMLEDYR